MRGPKPQAITVTDEEQRELVALVRRHTTPQQVALRARIVLAAAEGRNNAEIGRVVGVAVETARLWRGRWRGLQPLTLADLSVAARLTDAPRSGAPARIGAEQVCQIVARACVAPSASDRPISQWTGREVADEVVRRGILPTLSPRHAARLLKRGCAGRLLHPGSHPGTQSTGLAGNQAGWSKRPAQVRARKRFVVRAIWRKWQQCLAPDVALAPLAA